MHFRFSGLLDTDPDLLKKKLYMLFKVVSYVLYYKLLMDNALERKQANYRII